MSKYARRQFRILDLLLLLALVSAWTAVGVNRARIGRLRIRIEGMQRSTGELLVEDPTRYYAIEQTEVPFWSEAWQVFLPADRTYQVHLITRKITQEGFPENGARHSAQVASGQHRIQLLHEEIAEGHRFVLSVDGAVKIVARETADWNVGDWFEAVGKGQQTAPLHQRLVLKRLRGYVVQPNGRRRRAAKHEAVNGLLIWIEQRGPRAAIRPAAENEPR